jgi:WD40 repeat protein
VVEPPQDTITIWSLENLTLIASLSVPGETFPALAWSRDGSRLYAGSRSGIVHSWSSQDWVRQPATTAASSEIGALITVGNRQLLSGHSDGGVNLIDPIAGSVLHLSDLDDVSVTYIDGKQSGEISVLAANAEGTLIAAGAVDGSLAIWNSSGELLSKRQVTLPQVPGGHINFNIASILFGIGQDVILVDSYDGSMTAWGITGETPVTTLSDVNGESVRGISWSPGGEYIAATGAEWGGLRVYSSTNFQLVTALGSGTSTGNTTCWSPDGHRVATADASGLVTIWTVDPTVAEFSVQFPHAVWECRWNDTSDMILVNGVGPLAISRIP